ncbi:MAG: hypothetical protein KatS3mg064_1783 [Tepidiforma sp.]|nr:MAG: hypothetical protein KatS3mg064_1783 [Tepidiforma sp.]
MGVRHTAADTVEGVQFHPESIATEHGKELLANFLRDGGWRMARLSRHTGPHTTPRSAL